MIIRFREILQAIHKAGGSHQIWSDAQDRESEEDSNTIV